MPDVPGSAPFGVGRSDRRRLGREAEDRAAAYLLGIGFTLVTRRFQTRAGEIDLVCLDGDTLVFVEVKFRQTAAYRPEDSLGDRKFAHLEAAARAYLDLTGDSRPARLDLVAIDADGLRHYPGIDRG